MNRVKVSVTLNPELLEAVDDFVEAHPGQDRSKVIDKALQQWYAQQQEAAMEAQYLGSEAEILDERKAWRAIRREAAKRRVSRS